MPSDFAEQVYGLLKEVPRGRVTTYKDLAHAVGSSSFRAIGQIMRSNPYAPQVPCHRVVRSDGSLGGFMGGFEDVSLQRKIALLVSEGVQVKNGAIVDFEKKHFTFSSSSSS